MTNSKCKVCDSPNATNLHFGARSCKACAAFFRRSIAMKQNYDCLGNNASPCRINYAFRLNCRRCRLGKCFNAGMKKDLVQAKRKLKGKCSETETPSFINYYEAPNPSDNHFIEQVEQNYVDDSSYRNESEWSYSPGVLSENVQKFEDDTGLMGVDEFNQFMTFEPIATTSYQISPYSESMGAEDFQFSEIRSRHNSIQRNSKPFDYTEDEQSYNLATLYIDQLLHLNMRRKMTYTEKVLGSVFDTACICPYDKSDLKIFDHRTYRQKNRNDYTMILDYVNRFPDFGLLSKSEKTVLFRTAAAVDILVDQVYYSSILFGDQSFLVTPNGEYIKMDPLPMPENERNSGNFSSEEDYDKYKFLTIMKRSQWLHVVVPVKSLKMTFTEFALFKALTIWHHNYFKMQDNGRKVCAKQRDEIIKSLMVICQDEGHENPDLRVGEIILAVSNVMEAVHEMVTSYIEITVLDVLDDPILHDMLKFQY